MLRPVTTRQHIHRHPLEGSGGLKNGVKPTGSKFKIRKNPREVSPLMGMLFPKRSAVSRRGSCACLGSTYTKKEEVADKTSKRS